MLFLILHVVLLSQTEATKLKEKRSKLETEIKYNNKLLSEVRKNKKNTLYELRLINSKIIRRNELIAILKREIYLLDKKINQTDNSIYKLNEDIATLKKEYTKIAFYLYRNKSAYNKLIFLFSAEDLNQAYQRLRYIEQMSDFIKKQAKELKQKEQAKTEKLKKLKKQKLSKKKLLTRESIQLMRLEMEQRGKDKLRRQLAGKEKNLRARLRAKQKESKMLTRQIENTIASATAPLKKKGKTISYKLTPDERKLSNSFEATKGALPWPIEKGVVSETFGIHNHPVLKHVKIKNNGINIATSRGTDARAVFKGKVVSVVHITNTNIAVIIKHGEYFTVYSNLDEVYVKKNDFVESKQIVGRVHTNLQGKTEFHFEVWKGKVLQNPAWWLSKR